MINDGYTETIDCDNGRIVQLRPLGPSERRNVFEQRLSPEQLKMLIADAAGEESLDDLEDTDWQRLLIAWIDGTGRADEDNLRSGVMLLHMHPEIAVRSCESCQKFWYRSDGTMVMTRTTNEPRLRAQANPPPCRGTVGCPKGTPEDSLALSPKNVLAWNHYREYRAVGPPEQDEIVRRNWRIIEEVIWQVRLLRMATSVAQGMANGRRTQ